MGKQISDFDFCCEFKILGCRGGAEGSEKGNYFAGFSLKQFNFGETPLFHGEEWWVVQVWVCFEQLRGGGEHNTATFCPISWKGSLNEKGKPKSVKKNPTNQAPSILFF